MHAHREPHSSQTNAFQRRRFLQPEGLKLLFKCFSPPTCYMCTSGCDPELPSLSSFWKSRFLTLVWCPQVLGADHQQALGSPLPRRGDQLQPLRGDWPGSQTLGQQGQETQTQPRLGRVPVRDRVHHRGRDGQRAGRGRVGEVGLRTELSLSKNAELHLDVVPPSGSDLLSLIPVTLSSESHDPDTIPWGGCRESYVNRCLSKGVCGRREANPHRHAGAQTDLGQRCKPGVTLVHVYGRFRFRVRVRLFKDRG